MKKINLTIWNEFIHEVQHDAVKKIYPDGIHMALANGLKADDLNIRTATLDQDEQGLPDEVLNSTDVLIWWGHMAHGQVTDELVKKIQMRILSGMGLIVLHSGHFSKIFRTMMGTSCSLKWREVGERERLWNISPNHPITQGIGEYFELPHVEMYGERFDVPNDGEPIFISWYQGGEVFRSGLAFNRGLGKIFYFSPGHETFPTYYDPNIVRVISNAVRWAAPLCYQIPDCPQVEALEEFEITEEFESAGVVQSVN